MTGRVDLKEELKNDINSGNTGHRDVFRHDMRASISDRNDGFRDDDGCDEIASESIHEESNEQNHAQQSQLRNGLMMELVGMLIWLVCHGWGQKDSEFGTNRYWENPDFDPATYWTKSDSRKKK